MLIIRKSEDRGHANHGWLDAHHSFSFAGYHDPQWMGFRSLRVLNDDTIARLKVQAIVGGANEQLLDDVSSALTNLGYNKNDALRAAELALTEALQTDNNPPFATVLRAGLNRLTR